MSTETTVHDDSGIAVAEAAVDTRHQDTAVTTRRGAKRADAMWVGLTLTAVLIASLIPLYFFHRFYFVDDTESGAFGVWYKIGHDLRGGGLQIFNPHAWMAGNYIAEGQWGFYNPVILIIGLLASVSSNAVAFCTIIKIAFLLIGSGGAYALTRSFGAPPRWSAVAGTAVPMAGFTMYMDAASWVTALMIWALLPWFWVFLRRTVRAGHNPFPALLFAYLMITVGYVYGAIGVIIVLLGVGAEQLLGRDWRRLRPVLGVSVFGALLTATVYLPGVLTASVSQRSTGITNDGFLSAPLSGLATGTQPTALPEVKGFWGEFPHAPIMYIAWFLPLVALIDWTTARSLCRRQVDALVILALFAAMLLAPAEVEALRFPARNLSCLVLVLVPFLVYLLAQARAVRTRGRLYVALGLTFASAYLSYAQNPATKKSVAAASIVIALVIWFIWRTTTRSASEQPSATRQRRDARAAALIMVVSIGFVVVQHHSYPRSDLGAFLLPAATDSYKTPEAKAVNDGIVVGFAGRENTALWKEMLTGNAWYVNPHDFQNVYTPVGFSAYAPLVCMDYLGGTCPDLINRLFNVRPATDKTLADELSIDTIQIIKAHVDPATYHNPRPGWSIAADQPLTITWTRDEPVGPAGKPVVLSSGMVVSDIHNGDRTVSFRADDVPTGGGTVAFSRLNWPGYSAANASVTDAADGYLLQVKVPESSRGKIVSVTFTPPGWQAGWAAWGLALAGGLAWSIAGGALSWRAYRRRRATA